MENDLCMPLLKLDSIWYNTNVAETSNISTKGGLHMKITDLLGEATEYDKKQAVEHKKVKSWLKSVSAFANTAGGKELLLFPRWNA